MARAMLSNPSSHTYFFIQQAYKGKKWGKYGEMMSWEDAEQILNEVIKEK